MPIRRIPLLNSFLLGTKTSQHLQWTNKLEGVIQFTSNQFWTSDQTFQVFKQCKKRWFVDSTTLLQRTQSKLAFRTKAILLAKFSLIGIRSNKPFQHRATTLDGAGLFQICPKTRFSSSPNSTSTYGTSINLLYIELTEKISPTTNFQYHSSSPFVHTIPCRLSNKLWRSSSSQTNNLHKQIMKCLFIFSDMIWWCDSIKCIGGLSILYQFSLANNFTSIGKHKILLY